MLVLANVSIGNNYQQIHHQQSLDPMLGASLPAEDPAHRFKLP
jgi:hypothetical protein